MTWIAVVLSCCAFLWGDEEPPLALVGGAMLSVDGDAESKTEVILIRDGVIEAVGTDIEVPYDARRVDVTGLYVSPVFQDGWMESDLNFLEHTKMQGVPVDVGRDALASMSVGERTGLAPERRAWEGLPTVLPEQGDHRSAGFGAVVVAPDGMILAGSGAALHLNGHPLRESHLDTDVAQFGSLSWRGGWGGRGENVYPSTLMGVMAHLRQVLLDASHRKDIADRNRSGRTTSFPVQDRVLLALEAVISGEQPLILAVQTEEDIRLAIQLTEEFPGLRVAIAGGKEAWQVADLLAEKKIPVLLDLRFGDEPEQPGSKPINKRASDSSRAEAESADSDQEETPKGADRPPPFDPGLPARVLRHRHDEWLENVAGVEVLFAAGVNVAFASMGRTAEELLEDLRVAVEKGALQEKHAMRALTSALDVVSGVDGEGSALRVGFPASLVAWKGSPFTKEGEAKVVIVDGRLFDLRPRGLPEAKSGESRKGSRGDSEKESEEDSDENANIEDVVVEWPAELPVDRIPSLKTNGDVLIRGATILTASRGVLTGQDLLVRNGKIAAIAAGLAGGNNLAQIDASGMYLMPGIIDCHSHMAIRGGINESTRSVTAEVTIEDEVDPDDVNIYRALAGGVTTIRQLHGSANVIGGRHSIVKLRWGASAPDMVFADAPKGVKFALGENPKRSNWGEANRFPGSRMGVEAVLRRSFEEAGRYEKALENYTLGVRRGDDPDPFRRDLRLEALAGILSGDIAVHSHCYRADEILMLLSTAERFGFEVATLQHVLEGYKVAAEIAEHGAGGSTFVDWWAYKAEAFDATPYCASLMAEAGVVMSVNSDSDEHLRRLYLEAAKTVKYGGMDEEEALRTITLNPAKQLGIDAWVGSIDVGKDADFALFSHHPFDVRTKCLMTFVDGELLFERRETVYDEWVSEIQRRLDAVDGEVASEEAIDHWDRDEVLAALPVLSGQSHPSTFPRRPLPESLALVGGVVHTMKPTGDGLEVINPGVVFLENGRIASVVPGDAAPEGVRVVDVTGLHLWPGLIDIGSSVGLEGIGSVAGTMDASDRGGDQPDLRASAAFHPASVHIPVARASGITTTLATPKGGVISGQSSVMSLEGWTMWEALIEDALFLHVRAPSTSRREGGPRRWGRPDSGSQCDTLTSGQAEEEAFDHITAGTGEKLAEEIDSSWSDLRGLFRSARDYGRISVEALKRGEESPRYDARLAAMAPYALGVQRVVFEADSAETIADALRFAKEFGLDIVIGGGRDAWKVADLLAASDVPVLLGPVLAMPREEWDPYDAPFVNPSILQDAGVQFAFRSRSSSAARNLPYQAGMAVAFGLSEDDAMVALTGGAAEILGLEKQIGRLEEGLRADLIVTDGSPLQITTAMKMLVIGGREVSLETKHTQLYERYRSRLKDPGQSSK